MRRSILIIGSVFLIILGCKQPEARKPVSQKSGAFIKNSIERNQELKKQEEAFILKLIKKDSLKTYLESGNGFWYSYTKKDSIPGPKAIFGDIVNFDYNLKYINGDTIYSKKELSNQNYAVDKEALFFGLREAVKLLQAGESATFIFPSQLGYGYYGDEKKIGSNVPLISEVTVNSVSKIENNLNNKQ